jgi:hypothetical protein
MPKLKDHDRQLLKDLEGRLEHEDPRGYAISRTPSQPAGHTPTCFP